MATRSPFPRLQPTLPGAPLSERRAWRVDRRETLTCSVFSPSDGDDDEEEKDSTSRRRRCSRRPSLGRDETKEQEEEDDENARDADDDVAWARGSIEAANSIAARYVIVLRASTGAPRRGIARRRHTGGGEGNCGLGDA